MAALRIEWRADIMALTETDLLCYQTILAAVLPPYLRYLNQQTNDSISKAREEMTVMSSLSISMRTLVTSCEPMARSVFLVSK